MSANLHKIKASLDKITVPFRGEILKLETVPPLWRNEGHLKSCLVRQILGDLPLGNLVGRSKSYYKYESNHAESEQSSPWPSTLSLLAVSGEHLARRCVQPGPALLVDCLQQFVVRELLKSGVASSCVMVCSMCWLLDFMRSELLPCRWNALRGGGYLQHFVLFELSE